MFQGWKQNCCKCLYKDVGNYCFWNEPLMCVLLPKAIHKPGSFGKYVMYLLGSLENTIQIILSLIQQIFSRQLWKHQGKNMEIRNRLKSCCWIQSWKHCDKIRNGSLWAISPFATMDSQVVWFRWNKINVFCSFQ